MNPRKTATPSQITTDLAQSFTHYMQHYPALYQDFAQSIITYLPTKQHLVIVDIGCGPGLLMKELLDRLPESTIIGLEPNQFMRQQAKYVLQAYPKNQYTLLPKTVEDTSLQDDSVDAVVTRFSAYAWEQPSQALHEVYRILKPGGILLFELLNKAFPSWKLWLVKQGMRRKKANHEVIYYHIQSYATAYTSRQFKALLEKQQFQNIKILGKKRAWKFQVHAHKPA